MKQHTTVISALMLAIFATAFFIFSVPAHRPAEAGSFPTAPAINAATTSASFSVTASTRVLATTSDSIGGYKRAYATICNTSATPLYLNLDSDKPATANDVTYIISAGAGYDTCFEIMDSRLIYNGSVQASSTAGAVTVNVKDYVY
jgi:hypothetical protein